MKWRKVERNNMFKTASGLEVFQRATGWECTTCGLIHWESPERPGQPYGGCFGCGERNTEYGVDAPTHGPTGREVLGKITSEVP